MSKELFDYYETQGIKHEIIIPYTPQRNGVVQRNSRRTIMNMARSMLKVKDMSSNFGAKTISCCLFIKQISLNKFTNLIPEEVRSSYKLNVKHFKVFGSIAYTNVLS